MRDRESTTVRAAARLARGADAGPGPGPDVPSRAELAAEVSCEKCGSINLELDGWDIDKCRDCAHWRYRGRG